MTEQDAPRQPEESEPHGQVWIKPGDLLNDEDAERILRVWRDSLILQDPRYRSKVILKLATIAMVDEQFRSRLVNDTESVLGALQSNFDLPEGVKMRFFENTQDTLNVVLPPGPGPSRPAALRELLRSRTSSLEAGFIDDLDIGNTDQINMFGDPHTQDEPQIL